MIELNPEQRQAVAHGEPVRIIDPSTHDTYILVRPRCTALGGQCGYKVRG